MKTKSHPIISTAVAKVSGLLLVTVTLFLSSPVRGECPQGWTVAGYWGLKQSNQEAPNSLRLAMGGGDNIIGRAKYQTGGKTISGPVSGRLSGNDVELVISWSNGLTGIYNGTIDSQGRIAGTGYEQSSPSKKVSWFSDKPMVCRQTAIQNHRPRS